MDTRPERAIFSKLEGSARRAYQAAGSNSAPLQFTAKTMSQDADRHRLGNHQTAISLARNVLENPRATDEQKERARQSLRTAEAKLREVENRLGIRKNEA